MRVHFVWEDLPKLAYIVPELVLHVREGSLGDSARHRTLAAPAGPKTVVSRKFSFFVINVIQGTLNLVQMLFEPFVPIPAFK